MPIYIIYSYSDILESNECGCADSWKRVFLKYYAYFMITIIALSFISLIIVFIYHITSGNEKTILSLKQVLRSC